MRRGEKNGGNGDIHFAAVRCNIVNGAALRSDVHTVEAHLHSGSETGAKNLNSVQRLVRGERPLWHTGVRNTTDCAGTRVRTGNNHFRDMGRLGGIGGRRTKVDDFNLASRGSWRIRVGHRRARFENEGLVRCRVYREATPKSKTRRRTAVTGGVRAGAVLDRERNCAGTETADDGVSLARNGVRDGDKSEFRVIGDERVYIRLPGHFGGGEQFGRGGGGSGKSSAVCEEGDRGNGLIQTTEQVDLRAVSAGGVGVGERSRAGDRIDRYPLRGSAVGHAKG